jgi:serine protease Do
MRSAMKQFAFVLAMGLVLGAGEARAQYARRTAIVEAVSRTRDAIVTLKVSKQGEHSTRSIVGTGVIVDERGFMITNHHVIDGADRIMATLSDKTTIEAHVHTELPQFDLAILRLAVKTKKLKALSFAPGSDLMQGETIIAVGNPYGYTNSVSPGIISALGRWVILYIALAESDTERCLDITVLRMVLAAYWRLGMIVSLYNNPEARHLSARAFP